VFSLISKVSVAREMKEKNLVLKQVVASTRIGKLVPNWEAHTGLEKSYRMELTD